jgi:hypothetical protein
MEGNRSDVKETRAFLATEEVKGRHIAANGGILSLELETIAIADLAMVMIRIRSLVPPAPPPRIAARKLI